AITNVIVQAHLVDFATAEEIKIGAAMQKKVINYKDIMGLAEKTTPEEVFAETQDKVAEITQLVADKIVELNGGKSVSAVFVVGGGGKLPDFVKMLANRLNLPEERVALRGEEVLGAITFPEDVKKDPMLVTPIGICLNYYEQKNNFIFVQVNGERVKLYDNSKLTIVDAALSVGFPNDGLFPKRGTALEFFVNGRKRMVRGEEGEAAIILLNNRTAGINTPIEANDIIEITASTSGEAAHMMIGELAEYKRLIEFLVNGKKIICPKFVRANGQLVSEYYDIHADDQLEIQDYYTLRQLLDFMDVMYQDGILVNHVPAGENEKIYDKFSVDFDLSSSGSALSAGKLEEEVLEKDFSSSDKEASSKEMNSEKTSTKEDTAEEISTEKGEPQKEDTDLRLTVNSTPVILKGKKEYRVVDILDFYDFDVKTAHGNRVVIKVNGTPCSFSTRLSLGDYVELYWED
ncbi:MAG: cell division FtsA domain-containing protein, partial [Lachnospiraceae bacterium]|nr:cell division FtsA domain-containing protein [Lachnospiraceae bacterium]